MKALTSVRPVRYITIIALFAALTIGLVGVPRSAPADQDHEQSVAGLRNLSKAFAAIYQKTSPAVVGIKAERKVAASTTPYDQLPNGDLFEFFFRRQNPQQERTPRREYSQTAQGSGFIISSDGYILTNNHLVGEAKKVEVELEDERNFTAKIVGSDPESDVAVIKIDAKDLPYLELANSDNLEVGEWVVAIGSPFGLKSTLTAGIVSATGRSNVGLTTYENFIQTDAAINFGNSGGPLINLDGKAVGINSAILGPSGNIGIGFAIPMNMAKNIFEQLRDTGEIVRGFLGVLPQDIDSEMAGMFGLDNGKGVAITEVTPESAADKAGFKRYDVVLEIDHKAVNTASEFRSRIARYKPGEKVDITVWRDGEKKTLTPTLDKRPSPKELAKGTVEPGIDLGFTVQDLDEEIAKGLGFENETGVVVDAVDSGSPAEKAGIAPGTLIKEVNRKPVKTVREFNRAISDAKDAGKVMLLVKREETTFFVLLPIGDE